MKFNLKTLNFNYFLRLHNPTCFFREKSLLILLSRKFWLINHSFNHLFTHLMRPMIYYLQIFLLWFTMFLSKKEPRFKSFNNLWTCWEFVTHFNILKNIISNFDIFKQMNWKFLVHNRVVATDLKMLKWQWVTPLANFKNSLSIFI